MTSQYVSANSDATLLSPSEIKSRGMNMMQAYIKDMSISESMKNWLEDHALGMMRVDQIEVRTVNDCKKVVGDLMEYCKMGEGFTHVNSSYCGCEDGMPPGSKCNYCESICCGYCNDIVKNGQHHECPDYKAAMGENTFNS